MIIQITDIKQVPPITSTTASVSVKFKILGSPPDLVQIYAARSSEGRDFVGAIEVELNRQDYETVLSLLAGAIYTIHVCPRTVSNGVLEDKIEGEYWESYCQVGTITTAAQSEPTPPPPPKPVPTITSVETFPATLKRRNQIKIAWTSAKSEFFIVKWDADDRQYVNPRIRWHPSKNTVLHGQNDVEHEGRSGQFLLDGAVPTLKYWFIVKACDRDIFGTSGCSAWSAPREVVAQSNLSSVRQFLFYSEEDPALGIRRHLSANTPSLRTLFQIT